MTRKPRSHVKILVYRMWGIVQTRKRKRHTCTPSFTCILCINFHVVYILPTDTTGGWGAGFFNYKRLALGIQQLTTSRFSFWVIFYVTFLDVNECSIPDICPANFECKNLKFTYKCECRGGFKYQIKEKGKSKECVGEFQLAHNSHNIGQNYLHFTQKGLLFTTKLKKGDIKNQR